MRLLYASNLIGSGRDLTNQKPARGHRGAYGAAEDGMKGYRGGMKGYRGGCRGTQWEHGGVLQGQGRAQKGV